MCRSLADRWRPPLRVVMVTSKTTARCNMLYFEMVVGPLQQTAEVNQEDAIGSGKTAFPSRWPRCVRGHGARCGRKLLPWKVDPKPKTLPWCCGTSRSVLRDKTTDGKNHMGSCQNYGPFLVPEYNTAPSI